MKKITIPRQGDLTDWSDLKSKFGLVVRAAIVNADGELHIILEPKNNKGIPIRFDDEVEPPVLTKILAELLNKAAANTNKIQSHTLKGGLRIQIVIDVVDEKTRLLLAREKVKPSEQEVKTVLDYFPYAIPEAHTLERFERKRKRTKFYCVYLSWDTMDMEAKAHSQGERKDQA